MELWLEEFPSFNDRDKIEMGNNIASERSRKKWTQAQLAEKTGISSDKIVSRHEQGKGITIENIVKYASALGCSVYNIIPKRYQAAHENNGLIPEMEEAIPEIKKLPDSHQYTLYRVIQPLIETFYKTPGF